MAKRRILTGIGIITLALLLHLLPASNASAAPPTPSDGKKVSLSAGGKGKTSPQSKRTIAKQSQKKKKVVAKGNGGKDLHLYVVKKGDTLARIAREAGITVAELRDRNKLKGSSLKVGQRLILKETGSQEIGPLKVAKGLNLEEEEDGDLADENPLAQIERQKRENDALLGRWTTPDEPKLLVKVAMAFLGTPYRLGGSSVKGIDCSAFVKKIYSLFGIDLPRTAYEQSHVGMRVSRAQLSEGDLIFFHTRRAVGHVGIYIGDNKFVHASSRNRGVRVDDLDEPYFKKRFVGAVRLKGIDEGA